MSANPLPPLAQVKVLERTGVNLTSVLTSLPVTYQAHVCARIVLWRDNAGLFPRKVHDFYLIKQVSRAPYYLCDICWLTKIENLALGYMFRVRGF